jgi:hypothetical protein
MERSRLFLRAQDTLTGKNGLKKRYRKKKSMGS